MDITTATAAKGAAIIGGSGLGIYGITELAGLRKGESEDSAEQDKFEYVAPTDFLFRSIDFESSYKGSDGQNIGYAFGSFMIDPDKNDKYWENATRIAKNENIDFLSNEFKEIKTKNKEAKEVCREIYKKTKTEVVEQDLLRINLWKYCTVVPLKPWSIKEAEEDVKKYSGKWGGKTNNSHLLLSFDNSRSGWYHLFNNVLSKDIADDTKVNNIDEKFKTVQSGDDLKNVCGEAYGSIAKNSSDGNYGNNAREYCLLDRSGTLEEYPTKPVAV